MKFKVGDRVRIRQWDDMEKEFGLDSGGFIKCNGSFLRSMRVLCGKEFVISELTDPIIYSKTALKVSGLETDWTITTDMIELVDVDGDGMIRKVIFHDPATIVFWAVCRLAVLISRGWDKRKKRLADKHYEAEKEVKKKMCGRAILGGVCPKDCEGCAWNIAEKENKNERRN